MLRIRRVEEALADRYQEQQMRCPMHLCIGQEAIAVGVCRDLKKSDHVFGNHRAHGHYLAKGGDLNRMIAELYGRDSGCCQGRGGSMHLIDQAVGFMGSTPIVGGTVPLAVGSAWAASLKNTARVTVVFFGDGCFEEGVVHESLNFAALNKLPVIFVCENNGYSVYTPLNKRQPEREIHSVVKAHGIPVFAGNGNNVVEVADAATAALNEVRHGKGPQFLEFKTHRWREHCGPDYDDELGYRQPGELAYWQSQCPLEQVKQSLLASNSTSPEALLSLEDNLSREIQHAFEFALNSQTPTLDSMASTVYAA